MTTYEKKGCLSLLSGMLFGNSRSASQNRNAPDLLHEAVSTSANNNQLNLASPTDPEKVDAPKYEYRLRPSLLSHGEIAFYEILKLAVHERAAICPQVRLADIFSGTQWGYGSQNKINQRSVDFLLCEPRTMKPLVAIELDDSSHQRPDRQARDEDVDAIFQSAGLPLLHQPARHSYSVRDIEPLLETVLPPVQGSTPQSYSPSSAPKSAPATLPANPKIPVCPKCGIPMVARTGSKGPNQGRRFYGCSNYPNCREMKPFSA
jgi:very-short-patch-repair endonuclease